jgi:hypothetical protein
MTRISITAGATAGSTRRAATHYGRRLDESAAPSEHNVSQNVYKQEFTFKYDDLPTFGEDALKQRIPAGARIVTATLKTITQFTATTATTLNIGLYQPDGTVIDLDGIDAALAFPASGAYTDCDGALVGAATGLANDGQVVVAANVDDLTAGEATLVVEYEKQDDRNQAMNG